STFGNADIFGHFLSLSLGAAIGIVLFVRTRPVQLMALAFAALATVVGGATPTRAFLVSVVLIGLIAPVAYLHVRNLRVAQIDPRALRKLALRGAALAAVLAAALLASPLGARALLTVIRGVGLGDRAAIYATVLAASAERPVLGWGPENVAPATAAHRQPGSLGIFGPQGQFTSAHDSVLQALVTTGVPGAAVLVLMTAAFIYVLFSRSLRRVPPIAGPLLLALIGYEADALFSVGSVAVDWFPWLAFGGVVGLEGRRVETIAAQRRLPDGIQGLFIGLSAVACAAVLPAYFANDQAGASARYLEARQYVRA